MPPTRHQKRARARARANETSEREKQNPEMNLQPLFFLFVFPLFSTIHFLFSFPSGCVCYFPNKKNHHRKQRLVGDEEFERGRRGKITLSFPFRLEKLELDYRLLLDATNSAPSGVLRQDSRHLLCGEGTSSGFRKKFERERKRRAQGGGAFWFRSRETFDGPRPRPRRRTKKSNFSTCPSLSASLTSPINQAGGLMELFMIKTGFYEK